MSDPKIDVQTNQDAWVSEGAAQIASAILNAIRRRDVCRVVFAGGNTPRPVYEKLAEKDFAEDIEWEKVHCYWGDERCVEPDDPQSNYLMAWESLLSRIAIPKKNIHRIRGEMNPVQAALFYEKLLGRIEPNKKPRFDLTILGIGADGHIASLFPGSPALDEDERLVVATTAPKAPSSRVTLTIPALKRSRKILFLVSGKSKAKVVKKILSDSENHGLPAEMVSGNNAVWILDSNAASQLK